jgi:hypothetical protein
MQIRVSYRDPEPFSTNGRKLIRFLIALVLVFVLIQTQVFAQKSPIDLREKIAQIPLNSRVEVTTTNGDKLRGQIVGRTGSDFSFRKKDADATQSIAYDQVISVRRVGSHTTRNWVIGAAVVTVVVLGIIVARIAAHPLGNCCTPSRY